MENMFLELIKISPVLGLLVWLYYKQGIDYKALVSRVQDENMVRETRLSTTIDKNQEIIKELSQKFNIVEDVKKALKILKINYLNRR